MLSVLIAHIVITFTCLFSGMLFYSLLGQKKEQRPAVFYLISGLILLATITQIIVLFFPIGLLVKLSLALLLLVCLFVKWKSYQSLFKNIITQFSSLSAISLTLFVVVWIVILLFNAGPIIMDDTESYHIQSIKWIQEYGSVPGLVNLHERFGFNSSWFSSVALFSFLPDTSGGVSVLNSVLSMWMCYWFISLVNSRQKENNYPAVFGLLLTFICCLIIWPLLRGNAATTNYDFVATLIVLVLFAEIFFSKELFPSIEWVIWPAYLFTVRIINFPLLILVLIAFMIFMKQKRSKVLLLPIVYCLLLIIPFIIRNVIITGFLFYPATNFDVSNVDWKPDPVFTERILEYIKYYNRVSTTYLEIEQTKALGSNWIPSWFRYLFSFDKALVVAGLTGILSSVIKALISRDNRAGLLLLVSLIWLTCWFIVSPDPRFVYGVLLFGIFLLSYQLISCVKNIPLLKTSTNILAIAITIAAAYYFVSKMIKREDYRNFILPASLPQPPTKSFTIDGVTFRIPEPINNNWNARCYGTELPCLYKIDPRLKPRGKDIRSGFRLEK